MPLIFRTNEQVWSPRYILSHLVSYAESVYPRIPWFQSGKGLYVRWEGVLTDQPPLAHNSPEWKGLQPVHALWGAGYSRIFGCDGEAEDAWVTGWDEMGWYEM